ncbi:T9SS type A sorting domain-containing protein [bacterium]|nr:T9SS type A sorting domain-containing protein [bacterium]MBU1653056.1 T9SS type A sorting domain-containing protein [bacterium]MBU1880887.1 T9SS type A sorting domain-containing protein [bacterium]
MRQIFVVLMILSVFALNGAAHDYFPLSIGSWWDYDGEELDSLGNPIPGSQYNTTSTITGDTLIDGNIYYISESTHFPDEADYMRESGDTLIVLWQMMDYVTWVEADMCILPNTVGYTWQALDTVTSAMGDTIEVLFAINGEVVDFGTWTTPGGIFDDTYQLHIDFYIEFRFSEPDTTVITGISQDVWLSSGVGPLEFLQPASTFFGYPNPGFSEKLVDYEVVAVEQYDVTAQPTSFSLEAPYPNPFNPTAYVTLHLPALSFVTAGLYNPAGHKVNAIADGWYSIGSHTLQVNAQALPSGVYFVRVSAGDYQNTQRLVLLK